ncbi:hypothetical protein D3C72_1707640 [compost metagenome]
MVQLGNEHRGYAVQARAALGLHRLQHGDRIETIVWIDDGRAMCHACHIAQHHAKTVVQRHGNAEPVLLGQLHRFANEIAVVDDVAMGERCALRKTRGAAGELDVDRIVGRQRSGDFCNLRVMGITHGDET